MVDLSRLLAPRSVAVVGATEREGTYAHTTLLNLARAEFPGAVIGIHPTRSSAAGVACVPTLADAGAVDAVVIATPADTVPSYVAAAAELGCGGAIVYAAGFAEAGRVDLQGELVAAARSMPVIGPNGNGMVSVPARAPLWGDAVTLPKSPGGVALISDSGNIGVVGMAHREGEGLHTVISSGNAAVVDTPTLLEQVARLDGVRAVAMYVEGDGDGERWCRALAVCAERDVRVVVLKAGRSARGAAVGAAHTAALVGDQAVFASLIAEAGGVMVHQPLELLETARALSLGRRDPRGAAFLTCSGGDAAIVADIADDLGVVLSDLSDDTSQCLRDLLPPAATVANPLDHTAMVWADTEAIAALTEAVARDPHVGHVVYVQDEPPGLPPGPLAEWQATRAGGVLGGARAGVDTLVVATTPGQAAEGVVAGVDNALRAIGVLQQSSVDPARLSAIADAVASQADPRSLDEQQAKVLLARHGVEVPNAVTAVTAADAVEAARGIGYPVVLKILAEGVIHKSDVGGVAVGITSDDTLARECSRMLAFAPGARVLVEQMVPSGVEVLVAARRDGVVPTLTIGFGGVWAEALSDVACIPLPASADRVRAALETLRGLPMLSGGRGGRALAIGALCRAASGVGEALLAEGWDLVEVNPFIVGATTCIAVDAVVM
ncbi:MAG: acetate--CoA ligase family protein [Candidatus Nanopelagicales bacterium]